jgi:hypothetical protein
MRSHPCGPAAKSNGGWFLNPMKILFKLRALPFLTFLFAATILVAPAAAQRPASAPPQNLVAGVAGPVSTNIDWANYSALDLVSGALLFPFDVSVKTTAFYIGFTAGTEADIGNMVLYTTKRGNLTITARTPLTLKGVSDPMIALTSKKVCPIQPVSTANPCVIRLDPLKLTLSTLSDYYVVVYFADDTNNETVGAANATFPVTSLTGWFEHEDETQLTVGQSIPAGNTGTHPYFLLYVMDN